MVRYCVTRLPSSARQDADIADSKTLDVNQKASEWKYADWSNRDLVI